MLVRYASISFMKSNPTVDIHKATIVYRSQIQYLSRLRRLYSLALNLILAVTLGLTAFFMSYLNSDSFDIGRINMSFLLIGGVYAVSITFFIYARIRNISLRLEEITERSQLRSILAPEKGEIEKEGNEDTLKEGEDDYFEKLVTINVENLSTYYIQVKNHANRSFWAAMMISVFGFALIACALVIGFQAGQSGRIISYVVTAAGVLTEFISAVLFYLYRQTVAQMKEYHDSLLSVQNILLSLRLVERMSDGSKDEATVRLIDKLLQKDGFR